jgi:hypothetical protein
MNSTSTQVRELSTIHYHYAIALDLRLWCRSKSLVSYFTVHFPNHITVKEPINSVSPVL